MHMQYVQEQQLLQGGPIKRKHSNDMHSLRERERERERKGGKGKNINYNLSDVFFKIITYLSSILAFIIQCGAYEMKCTKVPGTLAHTYANEHVCIFN